MFCPHYPCCGAGIAHVVIDSLCFRLRSLRASFRSFLILHKRVEIIFERHWRFLKYSGCNVNAMPTEISCYKCGNNEKGKFAYPYARHHLTSSLISWSSVAISYFNSLRKNDSRTITLKNGGKAYRNGAKSMINFMLKSKIWIDIKMTHIRQFEKHAVSKI